MSGLQEKFQILTPYDKNEDDGNEWVWPIKKARDIGEAGSMHFNNTKADDCCPYKFNQTPPGMDISNQMRKQIEQMPLRLSGQSDVSGDVNPGAMEFGFTRRPMEGADDQYSGEHIDLFYSESVGEDDSGETYAGFIERNNYLDRI